MIKFGEEPYLECSSRGDRRFSAFYSKVHPTNVQEPDDPGISIESLYQSSKIFEDGTTGLSWREAKGRKPVNVEHVRKVYSYLWDMYFKENPELLDVIRQYKGFSDIFGQEGHACQAEEVYRIWKSL